MAKKKLLKWFILVICGCSAYFLGNYWGQKKHLAQLKDLAVLVSSQESKKEV